MNRRSVDLGFVILQSAAGVVGLGAAAAAGSRYPFAVAWGIGIVVQLFSGYVIGATMKLADGWLDSR